MGIDRLSFPNTAYYRYDFTNFSLGELMNSLAVQPNGVLVPQNLLESTGLQLGDHIRASAPIGLYKQGFDEDMIIVGTYNYFPTVYPEEIPTLIVNTESLFGYPEAATGYDVWLNIQKKSNAQTIIIKLKSMALIEQLVIDVRGNALQQIQNLTSQPEWLGLFGILSVGFISTGLLSCIGFILDSFAALRKNFIQLGILQAIGLSTPQMIIYLLLERLLLIGVALACGAGIGFLTSILFIPLLQMSIAPGAPVPPFLVLIGWTEAFRLVLTFGVIFLIAITGTIGYMVRIKIFQAVKMGESI
jgi:putative ABC transport system permease protein